MKVVSQRVFPVKLNQPQEHIEIPFEGTLVKFYWNISLETNHDRFFKTTSHRISQLIAIDVLSYGQVVAKYTNSPRLIYARGSRYEDIGSLKTKEGYDLALNNMTLRLTTSGKPKERKPRGHTGDPLKYPTNVAIQRLE